LAQLWANSKTPRAEAAAHPYATQLGTDYHSQKVKR